MNLDDLLKSIREEDDDSKGGKDLDDLLKSIRSEEENKKNKKLGKDVVSKLNFQKKNYLNTIIFFLLKKRKNCISEEFYCHDDGRHYICED